MISILAWYWRQPGGRTAYQPWMVNVWADMVRRHLTIPHRVACVTRDTAGLDPSIEIIDPPTEFESIRIPSWNESRPQCLRRLSMFAPDAGRIFGERFVCMDIDCVIGGNMDHLFVPGDGFRIFRGTGRGRPYNGSMMYIEAGARPQVYERFTPEGAATAGRRYMGSDQAWIMDCLGPNEKTFGQEHGVVWSGNAKGAEYAVKFYPGTGKPWDDLDAPDTAKHYRGAEKPGRCLILGEGVSVWDDAAAAIDERPCGAVIAIGEAAQAWPGVVTATAGNQAQARRYAQAMGYSDVVLCGAVHERAPAHPRYSERLARKREKRLMRAEKSV